MATRTEEIGRTETGQKCKKGHFDIVQTNFAVLFDVPTAVYAKTFSSSSIRDRFSKSAFWPKDYDIILVNRFASDAVTSLEAGEDKSGETFQRAKSEKWRKKRKREREGRRKEEVFERERGEGKRER